MNDVTGEASEANLNGVKGECRTEPVMKYSMILAAVTLRTK
jgi:hypothetical protein